MTNYDLEESFLLKWQLIFSSSFILVTIISILLTYNQILKHEHRELLFSSSEEQVILRLNRVIASLVALGFLIINISDKSVKKKYNLCDDFSANIQIGASSLTLLATVLVLYIAFTGQGISTQNPEL